jgi:hypothetical protein
VVVVVVVWCGGGTVKRLDWCVRVSVTEEGAQINIVLLMLLNLALL